MEIITNNKGRRYDVVVWGATGFTGRLVCEYLATHYGVGKGALRWAIAGRSEEKLLALRKDLVRWSPEAGSLPILVAESFDLESLTAMANETKVVCTTVGPYLDYGSALVEACIKGGADYCDLTGETPFIRNMMDQFHTEATESGRRIVHCCGFDSIPSDLGCLMVQNEALRRYGVPCTEVKLYVRKTKGGVSGGTIASMLGFIERAATDRDITKVLLDPYALNPIGSWRGTDRGDQQSVEWDEDIRRWTGAFIMAGINTRVVRRSNLLLDLLYGEAFRYSEVSILPRGLSGRIHGELMRLGAGVFTAAVGVGPTRWLLKKTVLPAPGEGPSREARESGFFSFGLLGKGIDKEGNFFTLDGRVKGDKDPGYAGTARMLGESAVCLALDREVLPERFGITTPAAAMGEVLMERLKAVGMTFEVRDGVSGEVGDEA